MSNRDTADLSERKTVSVSMLMWVVGIGVGVVVSVLVATWQMGSWWGTINSKLDMLIVRTDHNNQVDSEHEARLNALAMKLDRIDSAGSSALASRVSALEKGHIEVKADLDQLKSHPPNGK